MMSMTSPSLPFIVIKDEQWTIYDEDTEHNVDVGEIAIVVASSAHRTHAGYNVSYAVTCDNICWCYTDEKDVKRCADFLRSARTA
jgi:hypothetical protein